MIGDQIPFFLHYSIDDSLVSGELEIPHVELSTPTRILGTLQEDSSLRLLEFEPDGNISGILTGTPRGGTWEGSWFSPKTREEFPLTLQAMDTAVGVRPIRYATGDLSGSYVYQYAKEAYQGKLSVSALSGDNIAFSLSSLYNYNIADVPTDTVRLNGNRFTYSPADSGDCDFTVTFYEGFAMVRYVTGPCAGWFGHNATVEGIFLKVR